MWRHKLDMVAALATESAYAALIEARKQVAEQTLSSVILVRSGLNYSIDMLRIAGFVAPVVFAKELRLALQAVEDDEMGYRSLVRSFDVLSDYLRVALNSGVAPTLFLYQEALWLSDISASLPPPCGCFFAPNLFWQANEGLGAERIKHEQGLSRQLYQAALLAFLRDQDKSGLVQIAGQLNQLAHTVKPGSKTNSYHVCAVFLMVVSDKAEPLQHDEKLLFSLLDSVFFKPVNHTVKPEPVLISRLLHVIAKSRIRSALVSDMQAGFRLDGLLYGGAPATSLQHCA